MKKFHRNHLLNYLANELEYQTYLQIGLNHDKACFENVNLHDKHKFMAINTDDLNEDQTFDLISITSDVDTHGVDRTFQQLTPRGAVVMNRRECIAYCRDKSDIDYRILCEIDNDGLGAIFIKVPRIYGVNYELDISKFHQWILSLKYLRYDAKDINDANDVRMEYIWFNKNRLWRFDLLNYLIEKYNFKRYLEIGCADNECFDQVNVSYKIGVDPASGGNYRGTSDQYFQEKQDGEKFDLVFIDGLHEREQVICDVNNSLKSLNRGGFIVLHDCLPPTKKVASFPRKSAIWCGTVYQAFARFRLRSDLDCRVFDSDCGLGVIKVAPKSDSIAQLPSDPLKFEDYMANMDKLMGVIRDSSKFYEWLDNNR